MANHSIVQTLNFLRTSTENQSKLSTLDVLILIQLASRKGSNGIFPSQKTLAKDCRTTLRSVQRRLKYLQTINLITITKINKSHHYTIQFLTTESYPQASQIGDKSTLYIGDKSALYDDNIGDKCDIPQATNATENRRQVRTTNSKDNSKRERGEIPLSDFEVTSEEQERCKVKGIDSNLVKEKFILHAKASGKSYVDPHAAFQLWIERESAGQQAASIPISNVAKFPTESNCTECRLSKFSCRCRVSSKEFAAEKMREIMGQLKNNLRANA